MKYYQSCSQESTNQCKHFMSCDLKVRAFFTVWLYRDHFRSNIKVYIFWKQKKYKLLSKTDAFQNIFCPHRNKFVLFNPLMTLIQCEWREFEKRVGRLKTSKFQLLLSYFFIWNARIAELLASSCPEFDEFICQYAQSISFYDQQIAKGDNPFQKVGRWGRINDVTLC